MKPTVIISELHVEELADTTCLQNTAPLADKHYFQWVHSFLLLAWWFCHYQHCISFWSLHLQRGGAKILRSLSWAVLLTENQTTGSFWSLWGKMFSFFFSINPWRTNKHRKINYTKSLSLLSFLLCYKISGSSNYNLMLTWKDALAVVAAAS